MLVQLDVLEPELAALVGEDPQEVELLLRGRGRRRVRVRARVHLGVAQKALERVGGELAREIREVPVVRHGRGDYRPPMVALVLLLAVTAVWGVTFVQVKDAVAIYPLFAFLAVRYAIATGVLGIAGGGRVRGLGRSGLPQFDITVDGSGNPEALDFVISSTAPNGVCTIIAIYFTPTTPIPLSKLYSKGITIITGRSALEQ